MNTTGNITIDKLEFGFFEDENGTQKLENPGQVTVEEGSESGTWFLYVGSQAEAKTFYVVANYTVDVENVLKTACKVTLVKVSDEVTEIVFDPVSLTITNKSKPYNITIKGKNNETLDPDNISYKLYKDQGGTVPLTDDYRVVIDTDSAPGKCVFNLANVGKSEYKEFYVIANYTNSSGVVLNTSCKVVLFIAVNELNIDYSTEEGTIAVGKDINLTNISKDIPYGTEKGVIKLSLVSADPDGIMLDSNRIEWRLMENSSNVTADRKINLSYPVENDMGVVHVNFENISAPGTFDILASYNNAYKSADGSNMTGPTALATCRLEVVDNADSGYSYNITKLYLMGFENVSTEYPEWTYVVNNASSGDITLPANKLDPSKMRWGILPAGSVDYSKYEIELNGVVIKGSGLEASLHVSESATSGKVRVVAIYTNNKTDITSSWAVGYFDVDVIGGGSPGKPVANLLKSSLKVQVYNTENTIPITVRFENTSSTETLDYVIKSVEPTNTELMHMFNTTLLEDGHTINIKSTQSLVNDGTSKISSLVKRKKGLSTGFELLVEAGGKNMTIVTKNNVTVTFGDSKPVAKDVKVQAIEFDSYKTGVEEVQAAFTGIAISKIAEAYMKNPPKGVVIHNGNEKIFMTNSDLPATVKKGSISVQAVINDSRYILPENYNVTVSVPYTVKNGAPVVTLDKSSVLLNPVSNDNEKIGFKLKGATDETLIGYRVLDSKNKLIVNTSMIPVNGKLDYIMGAVAGNITLNTTSYAGFGSTYKVNVYAYNNESGRESKAVTVTVKTPSEKNMDNIGVTVKQKGKTGLDASVPGSVLTLDITGKNVNLYGRDATFSSIVYYPGYPKKGPSVDMKGNLTYEYDTQTGVLKISQKDPFSLHERGWAGFKVKTIVTYNISGRLINASYTGKIADSTVTPKPEKTKLSMNPYYDNRTIEIPITNLKGNCYNYTVDIGNVRVGSSELKGNAIFNSSVYYNNTLDKDVIRITPLDSSAIGSIHGKTVNIKITPKLPEAATGKGSKLKAKSANVKVTVLNPEKSKAAIYCGKKNEAKGSIDCIRDDTKAVASISFKNIYDPASVLNNITCLDINQTVKIKGKKVQKDYSSFFNVTVNGTDVIFTRGEIVMFPGTYKAHIAANLTDIKGGSQIITTIVTLKVVRGKKTGVYANPSQVYLVNRDYARKASFDIGVKDTRVNNISFVSVDSKYYDMLNTTVSKDGHRVTLQLKPGYIELKNKKPITKAVTKTVPVKVYYNGTKAPDTVKVKVMIYP